MNSREAAPLTGRLLARKSGAAQPQPTKAAPRAQPQPAKGAPRVQNVHAASPTLHTVDLTPPDFLRAENRDLPTPAQKRRDETS
jgi:hypothetical protein